MSKAANTRLTILHKAFELIYTKGYQTTSVDEIIATTQVTKGAFYYHFKNKDEMGVAIIEEILKPTMQEHFIKPTEVSQNPIEDFYNMISYLLLEDPFLQVKYGCPVGNLTQEMTPWNTKFSEALTELVNLWKTTIINSIEKGKESGLIRKDVIGEQVAFFILSGYWGIRNFGKLQNDNSVYLIYLEELKKYLDGLK
ncbi:TetR/AcrR family transcriptional regulator [Flavobacterium johnsoniae]|jgi:AcrR family transcriptional regulator|uniref:Transcriptional regulator n=1 Tax=Flavobacterium johnsoniae (strain ATCC 17061 / DSM 2064 / JCM 8514 / BCRC 14874 / CCUG 350202 / NBRC 14942 / NCIMB 11054 / UW101) TaxID=376686 RepID=A5FGV1_FLAJ1|nr:TetR/AcrR family transcriptional regulator [Flavobacterium johnsoniae]ABQ05574.1 transcriptional regulator [Flavobacterium johnsoniae UW101]OXE96695.1 TetR family transcriptional regulator [Flavobacterium johnsoniae UW101]WQG82623.1 TetR/AcrR family transcriptional regulator [Flavobacterium johnsoniae UW101]SHL53441.1 transcriptional regulator, TetR family [Flavobacterium johnsoniae]